MPIDFCNYTGLKWVDPVFCYLASHPYLTITLFCCGLGLGYVIYAIGKVKDEGGDKEEGFLSGSFKLFADFLRGLK